MNKAQALTKHSAAAPQVVETKLVVRRAAEFHVEPYRSEFGLKTTPWDCVGYHDFGGKLSPCRHYGRFLVRLPDRTYATICGQHLRMFARREWVDPEMARIVLMAVEQAKLARSRDRLACLSAGRCL